MVRHISAVYTGGESHLGYITGQTYALSIRVPFFGHQVRVARVHGYGHAEFPQSVHWYDDWTWFLHCWKDIKVEEERWS